LITRIVVLEVNQCMLAAQMRPPQPQGFVTTDDRAAPKSCAVNCLENRQRNTDCIADEDVIKHCHTFQRRSKQQRPHLMKS